MSHPSHNKTVPSMFAESQRTVSHACTHFRRKDIIISDHCAFIDTPLFGAPSPRTLMARAFHRRVVVVILALIMTHTKAWSLWKTKQKAPLAPEAPFILDDRVLHNLGLHLHVSVGSELSFLGVCQPLQIYTTHARERACARTHRIFSVLSLTILSLIPDPALPYTDPDFTAYLATATKDTPLPPFLVRTRTH